MGKLSSEARSTISQVWELLQGWLVTKMARTSQQRGNLPVRRFKEEASVFTEECPSKAALAVCPGICWHFWVAQALPGDEPMAWQAQGQNPQCG